MNRLIIIAFLLISLSGFSQDVEQNAKQEQEIYSLAGIDEKPEYPGGMQEFYKYVASAFAIPRGNTEMGKIFISFVIEPDGSLTGIKLLRNNLSRELGDEAIRVLKNSPKWHPGKHNGEFVRVSYALPINVN